VRKGTLIILHEQLLITWRRNGGYISVFEVTGSRVYKKCSQTQRLQFGSMARWY